MRQTIKRTAILFLAAALSMQGPVAGFFQMGTVYAAERSAVIKGTSVNVRSGPSTLASKLTALTSNTAVTVLSEQRGEDGYTWYQIRYNGSSTGYVRSDYVKFPSNYQYDAAFEAQLTAQGFPESYKDGLRQLHAEYPNWTFTAFHTGLDWNTVLEEELKGSRSLVGSNSISSYKSTDDGKFDWNTSTWPGFDGASWVAASREITAYYLDPRNFLDETYIFQFESQKYNAGIHTADGLAKMISGTFLDQNVLIPDVNGTLNADGTPIQTAPAESTEGTTSDSGVIDYSGPVSQSFGDNVSLGQGFEDDIVDLEKNSVSLLPTYDYMQQSLTGPGGAVSDITVSDFGPGVSGSTGPGNSTGSGSGVSGGTSGSGPYWSVSYAELILSAAQQSGVSPYVLAAMILQEQGNGNSDSISGTNAQYPGIYNYFNIGAYAENGMTAVQRGLWYASQPASGNDGRPWNTIEKSIVGGAISYASSYINAGQDTFYLKKWNVQGDNLYKHQYMTNVEGAAAEGAKYGSAYSAEVRSASHEFKIPVYTNMPAEACPKPTIDGNPNNKLAGITIDGFNYSPSFDKDTNAYTLIVDPSVSSVNISATALNAEAKIEGIGTIALNEGSTTVTITVTAGNGSQRQYTLTINKQAGGAVASGSITSSGSPVSSAGTSSTLDGSNAGPGVFQSPVEESTSSSGSEVQIGVGPT